MKRITTRPARIEYATPRIAARILLYTLPAAAFVALAITTNVPPAVVLLGAGFGVVLVMMAINAAGKVRK